MSRILCSKLAGACAAVVGVALLLGGCQLTPNFDARYQAEPARLRATPLPG